MSNPGMHIPSSPQPVRPIHPHYWWFKRILLAVAVLILALVVLRWWWGYEADRRLQAKIDEYRAAGQPVTIEDFQFPPVPDGENAAYCLIKAAAAVAVDPNSTLSVSSVLDNPEMMETRAAALRRLIAANLKSLRQARLSRSKARVDWGVRFTTPVVNITGTVLPLLSPQRELGRLLWVAAVWQHRSGDDAAAVETLRDAMAQVERVGQIGILIAHLTAIGVDGLAVSAVESVAADLAIADALAASPTTPSPARREQVQALIADLLDEAGLQEAWRRSMYGERLWHLEMARDPMGAVGWLPGPAAPGPGLLARLRSFPLAPIFKLDCLFSAQFATTAIDACLAESYPTAQAHVLRYPSFDSGIERVTHSLSRIGVPSLQRIVQLHFRMIAMRRMAATALAIRLYELDHGSRPGSLEELAPDYLSSIPADPFAADGRSLGYRPDAPKPVLYSVGADGKDDRGEYELREPSVIVWDARDLVFFLNGDRPRASCQPLTTQPATTQAVENEGDEVGRGGQDGQGEAAADEP